jgi:hypothetical protein
MYAYRMKLTIAALIVGLSCIQARALFAEVKVASEQLSTESGFAFEEIASPAINDVGANATWKLIEVVLDGTDISRDLRTRNGSGMSQLHGATARGPA